MATTTTVPVEEYLRTTYEPDMEYVNGQLVERNVGEYFHSYLQSLIAHLLNGRGSGRRFRVFTELRVRVSAELRYRIPDICVKALPHEITPILEKPDLVIEVLSPDDEASEMLLKIADYLQAGIPHVWIVDPHKRTVVEAGGAGTRQAADQTVETDLTGPVDFSVLFQELDKPAE
jgi:Uma2 family endonuclease